VKFFEKSFPKGWIFGKFEEPLNIGVPQGIFPPSLFNPFKILGQAGFKLVVEENRYVEIF